MKKKLLLGVLVPALVITSGASAYVITKDGDNKDNKTALRIENVKKEEPKKEEVETKPVEVAQPVAQPQSTQTQQAPVQQPVAPTPEENKAKIMAVITDYANSKGYGQSFIYANTTCFDRAFSGNNMYSNYESLVSFAPLQQYLDGTLRFDAVCKVQIVPKQP